MGLGTPDYYNITTAISLPAISALMLTDIQDRGVIGPNVNIGHTRKVYQGISSRIRPEDTVEDTT